VTDTAEPGTAAIECPDCGSVLWRRSGFIIIGDPTPGDTNDVVVVAGRTSDTFAWTCTCGRALNAQDPRSLVLDAMARRREPWLRLGR